MNASIKGKVKVSEDTSKRVEFALKERVKELESEVKSLKTKLDELRKAKNTTLIKHEKEYVATGSTNTGRPPKEDNTTVSAAEIQEMQSQFDEQLSKLKHDLASRTNCDHEPILKALQEKLSETESLNVALSMECQDLKEKLDKSYEELTEKEANHCESQEMMKKELEKRWQQMYREWMITTESKINELQQTNDYLRQMLGQAK